MQRSVLPPPTSSRPRHRARLIGITAVASALLATVGTGAAHAGYPAPKEETTAAYVYLKLDPTKPAAWENSSQQYLIGTWSGGYWRDDFTLDEIRAALPADVPLCGKGWAVQQDQAYGDETVFTESDAPFYPDNVIGWWDEKTQTGHIFDADHQELSAVVKDSGYVPRCTPTPTVTPSPTVSSTPTVTATPPAPTQSVTPTPIAEVEDDPDPTSTATVTPTPTPTPTAVVLATTPTPTPSATVYSQVLANGSTGGAALAATGSSPLPGLLAGGILVLSGAALLLLRRHRAS